MRASELVTTQRLSKSLNIGIIGKLLREFLGNTARIVDIAGISQHCCNRPTDVEVGWKLLSRILQQDKRIILPAQ